MSDKVVPIGTKKLGSLNPEPPSPDTLKDEMLESLAFVRQKIEAGEVSSLSILWDDSADQTIRANMIGPKLTTFVTMFESAKAQIIERLRLDY